MGGLVIFGQIFKRVVSFSGQALIKVVPSKVKWEMKFVEKYNLPPSLPCN